MLAKSKKSGMRLGRTPDERNSKPGGQAIAQ